MKEGPVRGPGSSADFVIRELLAGLERQQLVPGQRLVESELANRFGVGRNTIREALQRLAAKGIVDLTRNHSPAIRTLNVSDAMEVLDIAEAMTGLLCRMAAHNFDRKTHADKMRTAMAELEACMLQYDLPAFSRARRHFYRALLDIAGHKELERIFSGIQMQILYAQYQSREMKEIRYADYKLIEDAVLASNVADAEKAGVRHVGHVRKLILEMAENTPDPNANVKLRRSRRKEKK